MAKYVCPVCGYVHEGNEPPEKCPQCGVPGSKFTVMEEGTALNFVCEHVIGVGAKDQVEADVYEGLKANFEGECIAFNHKFINFIKHYKFLQTPQRTYK